MARQVDYECMNCGYELSSIDEIFWIDDGLDIHIEPLLMTTSAIQMMIIFLSLKETISRVLSMKSS